MVLDNVQRFLTVNLPLVSNAFIDFFFLAWVWHLRCIKSTRSVGLD